MGNTEWNENEFSDESLSSENKGSTEKVVRLKTAFIRKSASTKQDSRNTSKEGVTPRHVQDIPDEYVLKKKKEIEKNLEPSVFNSILFSVILFGGLSFACFWYCHTHDAWTIVMKDDWLIGMHEDYDYHFLWFVIGFMFLVFILFFIVFTFVYINNYSGRKKLYQTVKGYTLSQFKYSKYYQTVENSFKQEYNHSYESH